MTRSGCPIVHINLGGGKKSLCLFSAVSAVTTAPQWQAKPLIVIVINSNSNDNSNLAWHLGTLHHS